MEEEHFTVKVIMQGYIIPISQIIYSMPLSMSLVILMVEVQSIGVEAVQVIQLTDVSLQIILFIL